MPAPDLKHRLEKRGVGGEVLIHDQTLPSAVVCRHHEAAHYGANLLQLLRDAPCLAAVRQHVHLVPRTGPPGRE